MVWLCVLLLCCRHNVGIIFNTRAVWCWFGYARYYFAADIMRVLFLIPVLWGWQGKKRSVPYGTPHKQHLFLTLYESKYSLIFLLLVLRFATIEYTLDVYKKILVFYIITVNCTLIILLVCIQNSFFCISQVFFCFTNIEVNT